MNNKLLLNNYKIKNKKIVNIVHSGIGICLLLCLTASMILQIYCEKSVPQSFYIGISLLKSGIFFFVTFIICGYIFDKN